jgi:primosomal protein N'
VSGERGTAGEPSIDLGPECPGCREPWLRTSTNLPGRYRCVYCLRRFELRSDCPDCGAHSTIARMSDTANLRCRNCSGSMLREI